MITLAIIASFSAPQGGILVTADGGRPVEVLEITTTAKLSDGKVAKIFVRNDSKAVTFAISSKKYGNHRVKIRNFVAPLLALNSVLIEEFDKTGRRTLTLRLRYGKSTSCYINDDGRNTLTISANRAGSYVERGVVDANCKLEWSRVPSTQLR